MGEPHVLSALKEKRAELAGELIATENLVTKLKADLVGIDRAIKVFDPKSRPHMIKPVMRRGASEFPHGELSRLILNALRCSPNPMTLREIAEKIGAERNMDVSEFQIINGLMVKIRARLFAQYKAGTLAKEPRGSAMEWRVADSASPADLLL